MKRRAALAATAVLAVALLPALAEGDEAVLLSAEAEAYALRIEYDLPVPVGTGTLAHVSATAQRSASVESGHGLAAAPSELGAVVGGRYADPAGSGHPVNALPQTECNYPSAAPTHVFRFPTETQEGTAGVPATSYSYASCGAGPSVELRARGVDGGDPALQDEASVGEIVSQGSIAPAEGVLHASASSRATDLVLAGGAIHIGSVDARGQSVTEGRPGTASSDADIFVSDIGVGDLTFSLGFTRAGVSLQIGSAEVPVDTAAGQAVLTAANRALAPSGCVLTVVRDPAKYPQGFLFARAEPPLGVKPDGSLAASYRGGLLVVCDVPDNPVGDATGFSPNRFQALIGFVFTSVAATGDIGGFGVGNTAGPPASAPPPSLVAGSGRLDSPGGAAPPALQPDSAVAQQPEATTPPTELLSFLRPLSARQRWVLAVLCLALWAWLTHLGVTRLLAVGPRSGQRPS